MKLEVKDRLLIRSVLPQEGSLLEQTVARDIDTKIAFSQKELLDIKLKQQDERIVWDQAVDRSIEVEFTDAEIGMLKECVEKLDKDKKVTLDNIDLCVKIKECNNGANKR